MSGCVGRPGGAYMTGATISVLKFLAEERFAVQRAKIVTHLKHTAAASTIDKGLRVLIARGFARRATGRGMYQITPKGFGWVRPIIEREKPKP